jgi:DNA primase catalytic core
MFSEVITYCTNLLNSFPAASSCRDYLDSRLNKESQEKFEFGYFPNVKNIDVLIDVVGKDFLIKKELIYFRDIEDALFPRTLMFSTFENHPLIMPYKDSYGKIVAIVGRTLLSDEEREAKKISKYKNTKFTKGNYLFGLYENKKAIIEQDSVFIVEGQMDVIKAAECGLKNIVALGNANMTPYQFSVISRYTNNIFLLLDADEAGEKGRKAIMNRFSNYANIRNFYLPAGFKDVDEYYRLNGPEPIPFLIKG